MVEDLVPLKASLKGSIRGFPKIGDPDIVP